MVTQWHLCDLITDSVAVGDQMVTTLKEVWKSDMVVSVWLNLEG